MIPPEALAMIATIGLTAEQALVVARAIELATEIAARPLDDRRRRDRERKRESKTPAQQAEVISGAAATPTSDDFRGNPQPAAEICAEPLPQVSPQEIYNQPPILPPTPEIPGEQRELAIGQPSPRVRKSKNEDPPAAIRAELAKVLDDAHVDAVYRHRVSKKATQTVYAARLLAIDLKKTGTPNDAADYMIRRNWQGFEFSWWLREHGGQASASRGSRNHQQGSLLSPRMKALQDLYNECPDVEREISAGTPWADAASTGGNIIEGTIGAG